ncbi:hypothetical protein ACOME3_003580 [Neoechinorhynchus agilis]
MSKSTEELMSCCVCQAVVPVNAFNTCLKCLQHSIDITEGIVKKTQLYQCSKCERFLQPPNTWIDAALESPRLLGICLKRLPGLSKVRLVDAKFVWTEPHSRRLNVRLVVQKQDIEHKKTLLYLEQVILKNGLHSTATQIKPCSSNGIDFYFQADSLARKFHQFVSIRVPCKSTSSKSLISHDVHSNIFNYKYIYSVEIVPICKDSVICLPPQLMSRFGNSMGPICICYRVTRLIHLIDPNTMKTCQLSATDYFRCPFLPFCNIRQLKQYTVTEVEFDRDPLTNGSMKQADVWLVKDSSDANECIPIHCRTHLGAWLKVDSHALGYDLQNMNFNDDNLATFDSSDLPDVILVKKVYPNRQRHKRNRRWKLKRIEDGTQEDEGDLNDFMDDIEQDSELRQDVTVYRADETGTFNELEIGEMLQDLEICD